MCGGEGSSARFSLRPFKPAGKWWREAKSRSGPGRVPCPRAGRPERGALPRRRELRRPVCVWREGGRAARRYRCRAGLRGSEHGSAGVGEEGILPPERGLTLLFPPPDASPGDSVFICRSGLSTRPPSFPHPFPGIFSWRLSDFPPLPLRDPPPPPSSEGIISPFSAGLCPRSLSLSLYPVLCPSAASPLRDYLLSLWGDSSSLDLCPGFSLVIFLLRKLSLPFRLPLTGERGENVVVIGWAGVSNSAVISLVSVLVLQASGCRW